MLVLSRKLGEDIAVAGNITVKVLEIGPGRVRLGVEAPRDVRILRGELVAQEASTIDIEIETDVVMNYTGSPVETGVTSY